MAKIIEAPLHRLPAKKIGKRPGIPLYGIIHATRGAANGNQFLGTINWFTSANNGGADWGPSADMVIGGVGPHDGEVALFTDLSRDEHPRWSAGRGAAGTFPADEYGFSVEVAQSAALEDYTDLQVQRVAEVMAACNRRWGIPLRRIDHLEQIPGKAIPRGWVGHEDTANGRFTGKSDPGDKFPWARCFAAAEALLVPVTLTPQQEQMLAWLETPAGKALDAGTRSHLLASVGLDKHGRPQGSPPPATPPPPPPVTPPPGSTSGAKKQAALAAIEQAQSALAEAKARLLEV